MSARTSSAPPAASSSASRPPTLPTPTTATLRPSSDGLPNTRSQATRIAASTPSAVHGLGSPEPPRSVARPVTYGVASRDHLHVGLRRADVLRGQVRAVERLHRLAEVEQQRAAVLARGRRRAGRQHDHALAAAERQAGDGGLERHRAREPQRVAHGRARVGVGPHPAAAERRAARRRVHGHDRVEPGAPPTADEQRLVGERFEVAVDAPRLVRARQCSVGGVPEPGSAGVLPAPGSAVPPVARRSGGGSLGGAVRCRARAARGLLGRRLGRLRAAGAGAVRGGRRVVAGRSGVGRRRDRRRLLDRLRRRASRDRGGAAGRRRARAPARTPPRGGSPVRRPPAPRRALRPARAAVRGRGRGARRARWRTSTAPPVASAAVQTTAATLHALTPSPRRRASPRRRRRRRPSRPRPRRRPRRRGRAASRRPSPAGRRRPG